MKDFGPDKGFWVCKSSVTENLGSYGRLSKATLRNCLRGLI